MGNPALPKVHQNCLAGADQRNSILLPTNQSAEWFWEKCPLGVMLDLYGMLPVSVEVLFMASELTATNTVVLQELV